MDRTTRERRSPKQALVMLAGRLRSGHVRRGNSLRGGERAQLGFCGPSRASEGDRYDERRTPNKHGALWVAIALAFALTACTTRSSSADLITSTPSPVDIDALRAPICSEVALGFATIRKDEKLPPTEVLAKLQSDIADMRDSLEQSRGQVYGIDYEMTAALDGVVQSAGNVASFDGTSIEELRQLMRMLVLDMGFLQSHVC